jgi:D-glycerate 3-kinase
MKYDQLNPPIYKSEPDEDQSVSRLYSPVFRWIRDRVRREPKSLLIGINGPQGAGKSTLAKEMVRLCGAAGIPAIAISIDDFYLTHAEQRRLASQHSNNPFLQQRGYPGTHDISLGTEILNSLKDFKKVVTVPVYDKSKFQGQGDRTQESEWRRVEKAPKIILFEGWMLGFKPVRESEVPNQFLREINKRLIDYSNWLALMDAFVFLDPLEVEFVVDWRVEAEEKMKQTTGEGMSRDEVENYVRKFLPAYELYLPGLRSESPIEKAALRITIAQDRLPIPN